MRTFDTSLLTVENVFRSFEGLVAVKDASLVAEKGKITGLIGPNGAGKTTLFNVISGILPPTAGRIAFFKQRIDGLPSHRIARMGIARTFQDPRTFYEMDLVDHVLSGRTLRAENPLFALIRDPRTQREVAAATAQAGALLERVGLGPRAHEKAQNLSFGEQRFLSIARALAAKPALLMLDEPTVGLDVASIRRLNELIAHAVREEGATVLLIEHNMQVVFDLADYVYLMFEGTVVASGTPDEIRRHPKMIESYLGTRYAARSHRT